MLTVDGQRTTTYLSLYPTGLSGWLDGPVYSRDMMPVRGLTGVAPSFLAQSQARQIDTEFLLKCTTITERDAKLTAVHDAFSSRLCTLVFDDHPGVAVRAVATAIAVTPRSEFSHGFLPDVFVRVTWTAFDPASYSIEPRVITFSSTVPGSVIPGSLPSPGIIYSTGAMTSGTSRTFTYRSHNGIPYGTLTVTAPSTGPYGAESLGANDFLELSLLLRTITKVIAGVRTPVYHWKTAGTWFCPQPADCDRVRGYYSSLEVSSGESVFVYRQAWAI